MKPIQFWGWAAGLLAILPLVGIGALLFFPPIDPYGQAPASIQSIITSSGLFILWARSLALATIVTIGSTFLGLFIALLSKRFSYKGMYILSILSLLPLAMPSYIIAGTLRLFFHEILGINGGFLLAALCLILVTTPYTQLFISSAINRCSAAEEEAALLLGARPYRIFNLILWPQIRTAAAFSMLITFLYAISDFGAVSMLNVPVLTWRLYESVQNQDLLRASIMGTLLILSTVPVLLLAQKIRGHTYRGSKLTQPRQPVRQPLSLAQTSGAYLLHSIPIVLGFVLPVFELCRWIFVGINTQEPFTSPWGALWDSLVLAILGATLTLVLAWGAAWAAARTGSLTKKWLPLTTYLSSALPGVLLAFGLLVVSLHLTKGVSGAYGVVLSSGLLLFLGYAMRFLAEVFGPLFSAIQQLNKRHEDSALLLGQSSNKWFFKVAFPELKSSIMTAFLIATLAILKELPVTLILGSGTGRRTLAFRIWDRYGEAMWHDAGLNALILCIIALILTILTIGRTKHA